MNFGKIVIKAVFILLLACPVAAYAENKTGKETNCRKIDCITSINWDREMNQAEKPSIYPDKKKITPETLRLTFQEFYIPHVSEILDTGVDYLEWLNTLDNPYLHRYKMDLMLDPSDDKLKFMWKEKF